MMTKSRASPEPPTGIWSLVLDSVDVQWWAVQPVFTPSIAASLAVNQWDVIRSAEAVHVAERDTKDNIRVNKR